MRIATWNIQAIARKEFEIFKDINRLNLDIVVLTENKGKGQDTEKKDGYKNIYSSVPKEQRVHCYKNLIQKKYNQLGRFILFPTVKVS